MKRFLKNITVFILPVILFFSINFLINYSIFNTQEPNIKDVDVLIIGDSHPHRAINPSFWKNAENIAMSAEPLIISYWKLKKVLKIITPDTVIIGLAPHNISQLNDFRFIDNRFASEMFRRYYPIQNFNSIKKDIPVDFQTFYLTLWKETAFYPKKNHIHYMGRYSNKKISNVSDWKIALRNHYVKDYKEMGVSKICISYLDSILNLCHQNNIQPILVGSPVHSKYYQGIPQPILKKYYNIVDSYKDRAIIFSRTNDMSYPDSLFYNADHLNQFGSNRFMNEFIGFLNTSGTTNPMSEVYPEKKLK